MLKDRLKQTRLTLRRELAGMDARSQARVALGRAAQRAAAEKGPNLVFYAPLGQLAVSTELAANSNDEASSEFVNGAWLFPEVFTPTEDELPSGPTDLTNAQPGHYALGSKPMLVQHLVEGPPEHSSRQQN